MRSSAITLAVLAAAIVSAGAAAPGVHTVTIDGLRYAPETLTVPAGDRVVWINKDPFPHTVTSKAFDSKIIKPDASWSYVAKKPGRYDYVCTLHPTMKGTLIVQ